MNINKKNLAIFLAFVFVFSFTTGMAMHSDEEGNMGDCPFMGTYSFCKMGLFEHLGAFQSAFASILFKNINFLTAFFVLIVSLAVIQEINSPPDRIRFFVKERLHLPNFNKILLALSDGTIQPKLYA